MNSEIERLKKSLADLVGTIQTIRASHTDLDSQAAAAYRRGRASGLQNKACKAVINELHGNPADPDTIWRLYAAKAGIEIDQSAIAADDAPNPLDAILGPLDAS